MVETPQGENNPRPEWVFVPGYWIGSNHGSLVLVKRGSRAHVSFSKFLRKRGNLGAWCGKFPGFVSEEYLNEHH